MTRSACSPGGSADATPASQNLMSQALVAVDAMATHIALLRGQRVILDADLAALYDVPTKRFNEAVKRNAERFPEDFMFQLTTTEAAALRSQIATSNAGGVAGAICPTPSPSTAP